MIGFQYFTIWPNPFYKTDIKHFLFIVRRKNIPQRSPTMSTRIIHSAITCKGFDRNDRIAMMLMDTIFPTDVPGINFTMQLHQQHIIQIFSPSVKALHAPPVGMLNDVILLYIPISQSPTIAPCCPAPRNRTAGKINIIFVIFRKCYANACE